MILMLSDVELIVTSVLIEVTSGWVLATVAAADWLPSLTTSRTPTFGLAVSYYTSGTRRTSYSTARITRFWGPISTFHTVFDYSIHIELFIYFKNIDNINWNIQFSYNNLYVAEYEYGTLFDLGVFRGWQHCQLSMSIVSF